MHELNILSVSRYRQGTLECDGHQLSVSEGPMEDALADTYRALGMDHAKFFRMDAISKLTVLAIEPLFRKHAALIGQVHEQLGIVHMSRHGSGATDQRFWDTLTTEGLASPALFVYTLPNIAVGELTILHRLHGPSLSLLSAGPDAGMLRAACTAAMDDNGGQPVICGWSDIFAKAATATFLLVGSLPGTAWNNEHIERIINA